MFVGVRIGSTPTLTSRVNVHPLVREWKGFPFIAGILLDLTYLFVLFRLCSMQLVMWEAPIRCMGREFRIFCSVEVDLSMVR